MMTQLAKLTLVALAAAILPSRLPAAEVLYRWDLEQPDMAHWRKKSNCTLEHVPEQNGALRWETAFGEFRFGWTTRHLPERLDFSKALDVRFRLKGDGSGHQLHLQLGYIEPGKRSKYYVNKAETVVLDFTDWREVSFALARFVPPSGRDPHADMKKVAFIEFFLNQAGKGTDANLMLDDVRVVAGTPEQLEARNGLWNMYAKAVADTPITDGTNVLPNPGFELDLDQDGEADLWTKSDWGTASRVAWDSSVAHTGKISARAECLTDKQRGSFAFRPRVGPGPWLFKAYYRTNKGMDAPHRKGPVARLIPVDHKGKQCGYHHVYGKPTDGEWQEMQFALELPPEAVRINLDLFNYFAQGTVWWDDPTLQFNTTLVEKRKAAEQKSRADAEEAETMMDPLAQKVAELPAQTAPEKLTKTALQWAIEDARAALDAQMGTNAKNTLNNVKTHLGKDLARRVNPPDELMPPVRDPENNPYVEGVLGRANTVRKNKTTYKKGQEGYTQLGNAWTFSTMGNNVYAATWALCYPESPHAGDPELALRILRLLQAIFQNHRDGDFNPGREAVHGRDPNINRFCFVPTFEAYLLLTSTYPDIVLPAKRREWLESAQIATEFQVETYGERAQREPPHCYYANMDVHYMLMLELAARMFDEPRYHQEAETFCKLTADALYPDGAFSYHGFQNECFTYHRINVAHLARYWQLTGSKLARETVLKSRPYYPYNVEPGGVPEYYTDCFWKHYWSGMSPLGAEIVAGMTGCPHNRRIAKDELRWGTPNHYYSIYAATLYRPDIRDEPLPDQYLLYDRNVQGPRGRFGRWSFAGTTRFLGEGCQGKDTFVGGMVVDEPDRRYPLNAALQVVTSQVRLQPPQEAEKCRRWRECRYLSQEERNAVTVAKHFGTLTTRYRIQNVAWGGKSTLTEWAGNQQWILTPRGLYGVLEIEPLSDQKAYSIHGRIRFGIKKQIERKNDRFFKYGGILCRLHEHNYADVITEKSETFYIDKPETFRSMEIVLRDKPSLDAGEAELITYPKGTKQVFTVEVLPYWSTLAESVERIKTDAGLRGLEVHTENGWILLLHNPTEQTIRYTAAANWTGGGTVRLHTSGNHTPSPKALPAAKRSVPIEIPAHAHVVLEKTP